jgi:alcohol dehydrogenase class IV
MNFEFATATRIIFGPGMLAQVGPLAAAMGHRTLVVIGLDPEQATPLFEVLTASGLDVATFGVSGEPTIEVVMQGKIQAKAKKCDVVIGFGGGSAIDTAKAIAAMLTNPGQLLDYLEVIGKGKTLAKPSAPCIAIPTTAGTGAEVTRNAVLGSPQHKVKVSLRSPYMLPNLAVIDPQLTYNLPPAITASTGLDALTQVLEPYVSNSPNPFTDALCREGMQRAARSLRHAYENGHNAAAREDMSIASLFGGLALANAKLGAVHGFAGPFGGMFPAPHGATCAALLPHVMAVNVEVITARQPDHPARQRYNEVAQIITGSRNAVAADGVAWIQQLCRDLQVPGLAVYGLTQADFPTLIEKAAVASSMKGNPIQLTSAELTEILNRAL